MAGLLPLDLLFADPFIVLLAPLVGTELVLLPDIVLLVNIPLLVSIY